MAMGEIRFDGKISECTKSVWESVIKQWQYLLLRYNKSLSLIESPEEYTEWTHVGLITSAFHDAYPSKAMTLLERPVNRKNASTTSTAPSKKGRLDLWASVDSCGFDYILEAKKIETDRYDAASALANISALLQEDFLRVQGTPMASKSIASAVIAILSSGNQVDLDKFESDLWTHFQRTSVCNSSQDLHKIQASVIYPVEERPTNENKLPVLGVMFFLWGDRNTMPALTVTSKVASKVVDVIKIEQ